MYDVILFDLDGTLTDPKLGITNAVRFALARFGITVDDPDSLTPFIGPPLLESFALYYGLDSDRGKEAVNAYREHYATMGLFENAVYPGIPALLKELHEDGRILILATSKPTVFAERILNHFTLAEYFRLIVGSNLNHTRVSKTEVIRHILDEVSDLKGRRVVMVGDREHDIIGGRNNRLDTIAVSYGFGSVAELLAVEPTHLVHSVRELAELLRRRGDG